MATETSDEDENDVLENIKEIDNESHENYNSAKPYKNSKIKAPRYKN